MSYSESQKDATYITVSSRPVPDSEPGARIVRSMTMKAAIAQGRVVRLGESPARPSNSEINKFFRRLSFRRQVSRMTRLLGVYLAGYFFYLTARLYLQ